VSRDVFQAPLERYQEALGAIAKLRPGREAPLLMKAIAYRALGQEDKARHLEERARMSEKQSGPMGAHEQIKLRLALSIKDHGLARVFEALDELIQEMTINELFPRRERGEDLPDDRSED
jgi:hypothetical protein